MLGYGDAGVGGREEQGRCLTAEKPCLGSRVASRIWLALLDPEDPRVLVRVNKWGVLCQCESSGLNLVLKFFSVHEEASGGTLQRPMGLHRAPLPAPWGWVSRVCALWI